MLRVTVLPALALTALVLSGCGGGTSSAPASSAAPAGAPSASAPASSAAAPSASASSAATPSTAAETPSTIPGAGTAAAKVKDPCDELDAGQIGDLTGVPVKKGSTQSVSGSPVCTWLPQDGTKKDAAVFTAQEGPMQGSLTAIEGQFKTQFQGKVSRLDVTGADDARYVTGTKSGVNVVDVIAVKDQVFYQVLVATPRDAGQHKAGAIKIAETLLKG